MNKQEIKDKILEDGYESLFECIHEIYQEPAEWTIINALNCILGQAKDSQLSDKFWERCKNPFDYLTGRTGLTKVQILIVAILLESESVMTWRSLGKYVRCTRISMMCHYDELEDLVKKRWVFHRNRFEPGESAEGYELDKGVIKAFRRNVNFVPENIGGMDIRKFMNRLENYLDKSDYRTSFEDEEIWMVDFCQANPHLPLCHEVLRYGYDIHIQALLLLCAYDYAQWAGSENEGLAMSYIDDHFPDEFDTDGMRGSLRDGSHALIQDGWLEYKCEDGIADTERLMLTRRYRTELLIGYTPSKSMCLPTKSPSRDLTRHSGIRAKNMFYNAEEQSQIDRLTDLLSQEKFSEIQKRLEDEGMRKGFACLFYGAPGTGKTETVLQIARQTGRDIIQIDIAGMRDKYVGESEKNIKDVFMRYRELCSQGGVLPILFFNEADGIFGKRTMIASDSRSVDKMENSLQNIILQEMENLEGILIATTNLTCNFDDAFERRFLFKIEFKKPDVEVKTKLWRSMLGDELTEDEARKLAVKYDFSGGQIENIARQKSIEYILSGKKAGFEEIDRFCEQEQLSKKQSRNQIGFICNK